MSAQGKQGLPPKSDKLMAVMAEVHTHNEDDDHQRFEGNYDLDDSSSF